MLKSVVLIAIAAWTLFVLIKSLFNMYINDIPLFVSH